MLVRTGLICSSRGKRIFIGSRNQQTRIAVTPKSRLFSTCKASFLVPRGGSSTKAFCQAIQAGFRIRPHNLQQQRRSNRIARKHRVAFGGENEAVRFGEFACERPTPAKHQYPAGIGRYSLGDFLEISWSDSRSPYVKHGRASLAPAMTPGDDDQGVGFAESVRQVEEVGASRGEGDA